MKKTALLLCLFSTILFSCDNQKVTELTEQDKETIKSEISPLMDKMINSLNNKEWDKAQEDYANTPEFVAVSTGNVFDYQTFVDVCASANESFNSMVITESSRKYSFINPEAVVLTWEGSLMIETADNQKFQADPYAISLLFVKSNGAWTINYSHESGSYEPLVSDTLAMK